MLKCGYKFTGVKNALSLIFGFALTLLCGCGVVRKSTESASPTAPQPAHAGPSAPMVQTAENAPAPPRPDPTTPEIARRDDKEFEPEVKRLLALEVDGQFGAANKLCQELLGGYRKRPVLVERLEPLAARLNDEVRAAEVLGFSPDSLIVPDASALAETCFREAGEAGRVLLRKAIRIGAGPVAMRACEILTGLHDSRVQGACAERLIANSREPFQSFLMKSLWLNIRRDNTASLSGLYKLAKQDFNTHGEIARYIVAAIRRGGDDRPETVAKLLNDPDAYQQLGNLGLWTAIPTEALAVHFKFDEHEGNRAANSAPATATNAGPAPAAEVKSPVWTPGKVGGALQCDGDNSMVTLEDPTLEPGKANADFTVAFWFCLKADKNNNWRVIMHKGATNDERTPAMWMPPDSNRVHFRISTFASTNEGSDSNTELRVGDWTYITYVKSGHKLMLYFNGVKDNEVELTAGVVSNTSPLYIGKDTLYQGAAGIFDDFRIYTRALTESEIKLLMELRE